MRSSYHKEDVTLLLKDISGLVKPLPTKEREMLIQKGIHYCEMLPLEYKPSKQYMEAYWASLENYSKATAHAVCQTAERIYQRKGSSLVLVSLARAGLPIGILLKHYLEYKYQFPVKHYGISIIRGRGIDNNAMNDILNRHSPSSIQFVDGWIGKGAISKELSSCIKEYKKSYPHLNDTLAVLSDPSHLTDLCGTHEDILIPSSCLNSTVSGLISRTFLRSDLISESDYHGAAYYKELKKEDRSYEFIDAIEKHFQFDLPLNPLPDLPSGLDEVRHIASHFHIKDINFIKPGIGEATRVLLRRVPWKLLVKNGLENSPELFHLYRLAKEKEVPIETFPLSNYKACGIIKQNTDV